MGKEAEEAVLQWHPAFFAGIQIEFSEEKEKLIFENEHQLGTKPKQIDVLIIKKESEAELQKNIGKIFILRHPATGRVPYFCLRSSRKHYPGQEKGLSPRRGWHKLHSCAPKWGKAGRFP